MDTKKTAENGNKNEWSKPIISQLDIHSGTRQLPLDPPSIPEQS